MFFIPGIIFSAFSIWCIVCLFKQRRIHMLRAWGWLALCSFPAVLVQNFKWVMGTPGMTINLNDLFVTIPFSWQVLSCGQSIVNIFENWTLFFAMGLAQAILLSYFVARRLKTGATLQDPTVIGIGVFMCINAILATPFNWAGT